MHRDVKAQKEDRKQALRRYRKALAGIVCKQWLHFASGRLTAYRHHRRKLLVLTVHALASNVQHNARAQLHAQVLCSRVTYRRLCDTLAAWRQATQRLRRIRARTTQLQLSHKVSKQAAVLHSWNSWTLRRQSKLRLRCKAAYFHNFVLSSRAMCALHDNAYRQRVKAQQLAKACNACSQRQMRTAWRAWRIAMALQRHKRMQVQAASIYCKKLQQARGLHALAALVQRRQDARQQLFLVFQKVAVQQQQQTAAACLSEWLCFSKKADLLRQSIQLLNESLTKRTLQQACIGCVL